MNWFRVFNFETVVGLLVFSLATSVGHATDSPTISLGGLLNSDSACSSQFSAYNQYQQMTDPDTYDGLSDKKKQWIQDNMAAAKSQYEDCNNNNAKNGATCQQAPSDFQNDFKDFQTACGKAGVSGNNCVEELSKCKKTSDGSSHSHDKADYMDTRGVKKSCPALAGADEKKLEDQVDKQKDRVEKLQKELPDLEDKKSKADEDTQKELNNIKSELADKAKEYTKTLSELKKNQSAQNKALMDAIGQDQAQLTQLRDAMAQTSLTKLKGKMDMEQAKTQAEENCHKQASDQVSNLQGSVVAQIQAGTYRVGDFNTLMKRVGVSDRGQWQRLALKYYNWCLASKPTIDTKIAADKGYQLVVDQANAAANSIQSKIADVQAHQLSLSNPNGSCQNPQGSAMPGATTQACELAQTAQADMAQADAQYKNDSQTLGEKYNSIAYHGYTKGQTIQKQINDKKRQVDDENDRLNRYQEFLEAKYSRGGKKDVDSKDVADAIRKMDTVANDAHTLVGCARDKYITKMHGAAALGGVYCDASAPNCTNAQRFLSKYEPQTKGSDDVDDEDLDPHVLSSQIEKLVPSPQVQPQTPDTQGDGTGHR